ncbi:SDR family oxidoreductase [Streptomyces sp. CC224B]|uniref:SDR family oxidoreductase n=1 Tax=Streptomyces sp. CC224B TaxID=3044571 RepID=UPI0024A7CEDF|nr:SDR family oxidoreductase [Streptomyces sp. CC224B]
MSILFTGATGFLGSRVLRELLAKGGDAPVTVLGRGSERALRARTEAAVTWLDAPSLPAGALDRLRFLSGDITLPGLGLSAADRARATDGVTEIWHSAALLKLEGDPVPLHTANVLGTRHVLELADEAPDARLLHVSTAYVAGRRLTGHVLESDLSEEYGFQTSYEESKYTAERLVRAWAGRTRRPVTVLRPSLLATDRPVPEHLPGQPLDVLLRLIDDGMRARAAHGRGLTRYLTGAGLRGEALRIRVPADPEGEGNVVPAEYAARAMVRVADAARSAGWDGVRTVHVTHPHNTTARAAVLALGARYPGIAVHLVPEVERPTPLEALVARQAAGVLGFSAFHRTYDRTNLLAAVGDLPDPAPVDHAYLARACGAGQVAVPA